MSFNGPRYEWRARPWRPPAKLPVYYELHVNRRPVGQLYWTARPGGPGFYLGVVGGRIIGEYAGGDRDDRLEHRRLAQMEVERAYRDVRYSP